MMSDNSSGSEYPPKWGIACQGCALRFAARNFCHGPPGDDPPGRRLNLVSGLCLGMPLAALLVGGWMAETLVGGAWWAIGGFLGASAAVFGMRRRMDLWLREEVEVRARL